MKSAHTSAFQVVYADVDDVFFQKVGLSDGKNLCGVVVSGYR